MNEAICRSETEHYLKQGWSHSDAGNWEQAIDCVDAALRLEPDSTICWVTKGHFHRQAEQFDEAKSAIRMALAVDPSSDIAWTELGLLLRDQQFYRDAAECLRKSVILRPDYNTYTILANVELAFDATAALLDAEKALELEPTWEEALRVREVAIRRLAQEESGETTGGCH